MVARERRSRDVTGLHRAAMMYDADGTLASRQEFDPWGSVRSGGVGGTTLNYTGQRLDGTGLLFYNARYYDPAIGRFISADTVVPGNASGGMDGVALRPLTVAFHEPGFIATLNQENQFGPWYTLSDDARRQVGNSWGPSNPQNLNRYSYVQNNSLRWTDPTGHFGVSLNEMTGAVTLHFTHDEIANAATWTGLPGSALGLSNWILKTAGANVGNILTAISFVLAVGDMIYGNQGLDVTFAGGVVTAGKPTVDRQKGVYAYRYLKSDQRDGKSLLNCTLSEECNPLARFKWYKLYDSVEDFVDPSKHANYVPHT